MTLNQSTRVSEPKCFHVGINFGKILANLITNFNHDSRRNFANLSRIFYNNLFPMIMPMDLIIILGVAQGL